MKITKFVHSCELVEHDGKAVLFDPNIFLKPTDGVLTEIDL